MGSKLTFVKQLRGLLSDLLPSLGIIPTANLGTGTANSTTFLRGDQTYATVSAGIGGTTGSTDNRLLRSDGTGGSTAQASNATLDDTGNLTIIAGLVAGSGSLAVTTAFDVLVWQGGKLGFASASVGLGSSGDAYFVRNGVSSIGAKGSAGVDATFTCGAITASGVLVVPQGTAGLTTASIQNGSFREFGLNFYGNNKLGLSRNTTAIWEAGQTGPTPYFTVSSTAFLGFSSSATAGGISLGQTCFYQASAGVIEINNGIAGTLRDLSCRAITASGALNLAPITKAALLLLTPNAATGGRWRVTDATPASREAYPDGTNWRYTSDDTVVT